MSDILIESFQPARINSVDDYRRFRHTLNLIKRQSSAIPASDKEAENRLMKTLGYAKPDKFRNHRREWDRLERRIPLKYFNKIGIDRKVLQFTLELDAEEFEQACSVQTYPETAVMKLIPAVYKKIVFNKGTDEIQAIEQLKEIAVETGRTCLISFPELKSISIRPDGTVAYIFYPPELDIGESWITVKRDGRTTGVSKLR
ncbi:MAG: hypothetical protein EH225_08615 [Calditrichaeota bacterium]|nr:hypothetical protein [Spirochaetales bacterium]RQW02332.1 MAG: hypothetical protein EH225_08615 [Calditrichota bacterium]